MFFAEQSIIRDEHLVNNLGFGNQISLLGTEAQRYNRPVLTDHLQRESQRIAGELSRERGPQPSRGWPGRSFADVHKFPQSTNNQNGFASRAAQKDSG